MHLGGSVIDRDGGGRGTVGRRRLVTMMGETVAQGGRTIVSSSHRLRVRDSPDPLGAVEERKPHLRALRLALGAAAVGGGR